MLLQGCDAFVSPPDSRSSQPAADKATPRYTDWVAYPQVFLRDLQVHSLAATPNRLLATTLGGTHTKIVSISESGAITPFAAAFRADPDARCVVAVSPGWGSQFPIDEVYASRGCDVFRLGTDGSRLTRVTTLPEAEREVAGMCFDPTGRFRYGLVFVGAAGGVYRLDGVRPLARIGSVDAGATAAAIPASGLQQGRLLVTFSDRGEVVAMTSGGQTSTLLGWSGVSSALPLPSSLYEFGRSHGALFIATHDGTLFRFPQESVGQRPGSLVLTSVYASGNGLAEPDGSTFRVRPFSPPWGAEHCAAVVQSMAVLQPAMDVQPASPLNHIRPGSTAKFAVAVLDAGWFRVADLDLSSVRLAGALPVPLRRGQLGIYRDVDGDGAIDVELFFRPCDLQVSSAATHVTLTGDLITGESVRATDRVAWTAASRGRTPHELGVDDR